VSGPTQAVHVRVNDAATGKPTPVRVRFTDEAGTYYAPLGRLTEFSQDPGIDVGGNTLIDDEAWAYVDGAFEILLPPGRIRVQVAKGPEYRLLDDWHVVQAGRLSMRLTIERFIDMRAQGWFSGDVATYNLTPHAALLEAAGEDVALLQLLVVERRIENRHSLANICAFSGQEPALANPPHAVIVNSKNQSDLGDLVLLHAHRPIFPLSFRSATDSWILEDWCDQCHRKGGLVIADHWLECWRGEAPEEMLAEIVRGKIDALLAFDRESLGFWYEFLNAGLRIPLAAGSRKDSNCEVVGKQRVYAYVGNEILAPGNRDWIEAVRRGRSFVTNGPLMLVRFDEFFPGDSVLVERAKLGLNMEVVVRSAEGFHDAEIVFNGEVVDRFAADQPRSVVSLTAGIGGWLAARYVSPDGALWAHTNPIYVEGNEWPQRAGARARLTARLDRNLRWAREPGNVADDRAREHLIQVLVEAKNALQRDAPHVSLEEEADAKIRVASL